MRRDVKKYLFVGHHKALEEFFGKAQEAALVHFVDTSHFKVKELPSDIQNVVNAIKVVVGLPTIEQERPHSYVAAEPIAESILALNHAIQHLEEERRMVRLEIARTEVFGQFSLEDIHYLEQQGNRKVRFFFAKKGRIDEKTLPSELIRIASAHGMDYFVAITIQPTQYDHMIEIRLEHELGTLKRRFEEVQWEIQEKEQELKTFSKYNEFLHHALVKKYNEYNLVKTENFASQEMDGGLFAVEGWVPENKIDKLRTMMEKLDVYISGIAKESKEVIPTYLENKGLSRVGEDLVNIYDTPSNKDKDPSLWVLLSFGVFFAMIMRDGGYGLVFLAAALYFRYKNPKIRNGNKRVWKLTVFLFSSCIVWGVLTNSFFGINFAPDSVVRKVSVLNWLVEKKAAYHFEEKDLTHNEWVAAFPELEKVQTSEEFLVGAKTGTDGKIKYKMIDTFTDEIMMELALLAGIIHISLSFIRYLDRSWAGIGWVVAIIGCYLSFPALLQATTAAHYVFGFDKEIIAQEGMYMIYVGLSAALILALIQHRIYGLLEITSLIQIFGDILSYLRLYALGLSGSIISSITNDMAGSTIFLGSVLLLILGHGLNMTLAIVGGVIHGLRLNFIEWYHYSFEGGGKPFNPLRKMTVD